MFPSREHDYDWWSESAGRKASRWFSVLLVLGAVGLVAAFGAAAARSIAPERAWEAKYRPQAEVYCRENPEMKYRKYLNADGSDPAPHMDAFEYCVAAHLSHMPPPGAD